MYWTYEQLVVAGISKAISIWCDAVTVISTRWEEIGMPRRCPAIRGEGMREARPWRTDVTEIRSSIWWARCRNGSRTPETVGGRVGRTWKRTLRPPNRASQTRPTTIYWCRSCTSPIASWSGIGNSSASASIWSWANWPAGNRRIKVTPRNGPRRTSIRPLCRANPSQISRLVSLNFTFFILQC